MTTNSHRYGMSGLPAVETEKWGRSKADSLAGPLEHRSGAPQPKDQSRPQAPEDKRAPGYPSDHRNDWIRGRGESAEGKPGGGYIHGYRPKGR
jgi:hypothetical protein